MCIHTTHTAAVAYNREWGKPKKHEAYLATVAASTAPNSSSLPDHGFGFSTLIRDSLLEVMSGYPITKYRQLSFVGT